MKESALGLK